MSPPANPYAKPRPAAVAAASVFVVNQPQKQAPGSMGRQSQQRVNQTKRAYKLACSGQKRKGDQLTLQGDRAFQPEKDCVVCRARALARIVQGARIPNRAHHVLCVKNKKTKGAGDLSEQNIANNMEEKRLKALFNTPLSDQEKGSGRHLTKAATTSFFAPKKSLSAQPIEKTSNMMDETVLGHIDFGKSVLSMINDPSFRIQHKNKQAPLAMIAFASEVVEKIVRSKNTAVFNNYFNGLTITVPPCDGDYNNPHYHSIVGQKLLLVDWGKTFGVTVACPDSSCKGTLKNDRTNFSKNKTLFPLFGIDGPPAWCMVMRMTCSCCRRDFNANEAAVLLSLPGYIAQQYPVETKYALTSHSFHLTDAATNILDNIMVTYANGELCSRLLYSSINKAYVQKITGYYSYHRTHKAAASSAKVIEYIRKDGVYIKQFPPQGDTIRDMYDEALSTKNNPWGVSDHDRHTLEIQNVGCRGIFAQDHTFEAVKNYQKALGAKAIWDAATSTGEIASIVCVPTTKTIHFSHAARQLMERPRFSPQAMYSDTWPNKKEYWEDLIPNVKGRLGLFHFQKRILRTLRKKHVDFHDAVGDLLMALYEYEAKDYENVLSALKNGTLSPTGKQYTTEEISDLQLTKYFRVRYGKYLRKQLREPHTMIQRLDDWFCKYKVTASDPDIRPARGRLDPYHNIPLFRKETREAVNNCKEKAIHLCDPMSIDKMYDEIRPNPNSKHQLTEYLSRRGESKLEAFHDRLAHFANSGMRDSLADNLHLAGTARYNLSIRHKRSLMTLENTERSLTPAAWEKIVPHWNHAELGYINAMAIEVDCLPPFPKAERLPKDNGERFFSEYIKQVNPSKERYNGDHCWCSTCRNIIGDKKQQPAQDTHLEQPIARVPTVAVPAAVRQPEQIQRVQPVVNTTTPVNNSIVAAPTQQTQLFSYNQFQQWMFPPVPMFYMHTPAVCCGKYMNWLVKRRGRPPHDPHCGTRSGSNLTQTVGAWCNSGTSQVGGGQIEKRKEENNFTI